MSRTEATRSSTSTSDSLAAMLRAVSRMAEMEERTRWLAQITIEMPASRKALAGVA